MAMKWQHWVFLALVFIVGFWARGKAPGLFSKIPGASTVGLSS